MSWTMEPVAIPERIAKALRSLAKGWHVVAAHADHMDGEFANALYDVKRYIERLHPAPRWRVVRVLDEWRVLDSDGREAQPTWHRFTDFANAQDHCATHDKFSPSHAPHRVMRLALVDADAEPPRGRVVLDVDALHDLADWCAKTIDAAPCCDSCDAQWRRRRKAVLAALALVDADAPEVGIAAFAHDLASKQQTLPADEAKVLNDNFWQLAGAPEVDRG